MAGDWIKMRSNLWDDPRIAGICDRANCSEAEAVGALYWLWATADQHSEDGIMLGLSIKAIDRKCGVHGFGSALVAVGWLADHPEGVRIVRFDEHNGKSAKRRCSESVRKMSARDADKQRDESGNDAEEQQQTCAPRERERGDISTTDVVDKRRAPRFDAQAHLVGAGVDPQVAGDWLKLRKAKKAAPTLTAIDGITDEAAKAGMSLSDALAVCCQRGWTGFKADWVANMATQQQPRMTQHQLNQAGIAASLFGQGAIQPRTERLIAGEVVQ